MYNRLPLKWITSDYPYHFGFHPISPGLPSDYPRIASGYPGLPGLPWITRIILQPRTTDYPSRFPLDGDGSGQCRAGSAGTGKDVRGAGTYQDSVGRQGNGAIKVPTMNSSRSDAMKMSVPRILFPRPRPLHCALWVGRHPHTRVRRVGLPNVWRAL